MTELARLCPVHAMVVIPTLNEAEHIAGVLEQLLEPDSATLRLTYIVADGGSSDGTSEIVEKIAKREPRLRLIQNPARIQSAAVNLAVRRFGKDADVLIRCDAHAHYPAQYCSRLVAALTAHEADAVGVPLDSTGQAPLQRAIAWISNSPVGTGGSAHRAGCTSGFVDHGHHAAFRLSSFRRAGGYDHSFTHNEDAELDCRHRALGARIYLDCSLRVDYAPRKDLGALYRQYFKYGEGRSRTVRRHPHSLRLRQLAVPTHLVLAGAAVLASAWLPWLLVWPALYLLTLLAVASKLAWQHRSASALLGVAAAVTMHTAWALGFFAGLARHRERIWLRHMAVPLSFRSITGGVS
jgi:succinoglycan biosynthesis protein ExoA